MSLKIQPVPRLWKNGALKTKPRAHTRAQPKGRLIFLCLLCFPPRRFSSRDRRPQNGSASTGKLHYSNVRCGNRSNSIAGLTVGLSVFFVNLSVLSVLCGFRSSVREFRRIFGGTPCRSAFLPFRSVCSLSPCPAWHK